MFDLLIPFHTILGDKGIHQRGLFGLFGAVDKAAAVLLGGGSELVRCAVEGRQALALVDVVAALLNIVFELQIIFLLFHYNHR